jgi:hypothetical protein
MIEMKPKPPSPFGPLLLFDVPAHGHDAQRKVRKERKGRKGNSQVFFAFFAPFAFFALKGPSQATARRTAASGRMPTVMATTFHASRVARSAMDR